MTELAEFDTEPTPGLPGRLPAGETILWQGAPDGYRLAIEAFHVRKVALYFLLLLGLNLKTLHEQGPSLAAFMSGPAVTLVLALAALGILGGLAWLMATATVYTLTTERLCIRFGIALQLTLNLPFTQIRAADLRLAGNGHGDIPLTVSADERISYLVLWPHVRPWHWRRPQPMLRAIPDARHVADQLAEAVAAAALRRSGDAASIIASDTGNNGLKPCRSAATPHYASPSLPTHKALASQSGSAHRQSCHS